MASRTPTELIPVRTQPSAVVPRFEHGHGGLPARLPEVIVNRHPLPHLLHPDLVPEPAAAERPLPV